MARVELWGGLECTVNRVGDAYVDQTLLCGHETRDADLDLFAELGLAALRYPVLWERVAPDSPDTPDWRWSDKRLNGLRARNIRPIVGLVHHGSGPRYTDLLDDGFASGLAAFAAQVAERYDWVTDWTPVNEPLTTARFSGLYGHWYPHHRDERSFWRALLNQVDGIRMAMRAVRRVNPAARLIQTDDLGRTYSTLRLAEQAAYDNMRRWAGWDLLFGRITPHHPLWMRIARFGLGDRLRRIVDDPSPPDIVGVNHYLTSDRFLDHRLQRYDPHTHGGNAKLAYADTEAIRVLDPAPAGIDGALREAWQRYGVPVAITEVHNGCTREEQMRWAAEAWDTAAALQADGVGVRAVTAWSLLGSHSWNTLLTRPGVYEPGVYDVSSGRPRPTALAALWRGLPLNAPRHPVVAAAGWWRRRERMIYRPIVRPSCLAAGAGGGDGPPLLICGATGRLGRAFAQACGARNIAYVLTDRAAIDLDRPHEMPAVLDRLRPWAVINAAGWSDIDDAEAAPDACWSANASGAVALAAACVERAIGYLGLSSDLVFGGEADRAYVETDATQPLNAFGRSKAAMEAGCRDLPGVLVVRTGPCLSVNPDGNFAVAVVDSLALGHPFLAADDHMVTPAFVPQLIDAAIDLLIDGATGIRHLAHDDAVSWAELGRRVARACGLDERLIVGVPSATLGGAAARPRAVPLGSGAGAMLGSLDGAIQGFAAAIAEQRAIRACA